MDIKEEKQSLSPISSLDILSTQEEYDQQRLYNAIGKKYQKNFIERWSSIYRERFIYKHLFRNLDFQGKKVLDAMCGPISITSELLKRGADVTALDSSSVCLQLYSELYPQCTTRCASILHTGFQDDTFDVVFIIAGLHHLHPYLIQGVDEITRILKPGGIFCFVEPHRGSVLDLFRKVWYKMDSTFEKNEASVDIKALKTHFSGRYAYIFEKYFGSIAFFLVFQSFIFRIPERIKKYYSPFLLGIEALLSPFQTKYFSACGIWKWEKLPVDIYIYNSEEVTVEK